MTLYEIDAEILALLETADEDTKYALRPDYWAELPELPKED